MDQRHAGGQVMGIIHETCRKLADAGNSLEVILDAVRMMEDGAKPPRKGRDGSPRAELEAVVDSMRAQALLDHRQAKGAKLTAYAAKLLAAELAKCDDPGAAVDLIILKGWQGFKASWYEKERAGQYQPGRPMTAMDHRRESLRQRIENGQASGSERSGSPELAGYLPYR